MTLYGIPTCDTCRKARKALEAAGHAVALHDVRAQPLAGAEIAAFLDVFGDALVNRKSTTWRGLSDDERGSDPAALLAAHPPLMKRPVITDGTRRTLGWSDAICDGWGSGV
ncbi:MAG: ArsC/Spx/MgsR family protein [Pseudomonadota bacterium]